MTQVTFDELRSRLAAVLNAAGLAPEDAELCARIHAESTRDGVVSHGIGRIPRFVDYLNKGWVDPAARLSLVQRLGALEVFDGHFGIGVRHALDATKRAMELASEHGMGLVAVRNTTHWMRGGSYGWHAVERGYAAIMWTNTESCMPAWGAASQSIGNNPLVMAVPAEQGPMVLDMAMSQFSYGKLNSLALAGESLPVDGGFDQAGQLSRDPGAIAESRRLLPAGYWKGSGLAMLLDVMAALLSQGNPTHHIDTLGRGSGGGASQVFLGPSTRASWPASRPAMRWSKGLPATWPTPCRWTRAGRPAGRDNPPEIGATQTPTACSTCPTTCGRPFSPFLDKEP